VTGAAKARTRQLTGPITAADMGRKGKKEKKPSKKELEAQKKREEEEAAAKAAKAAKGDGDGSGSEEEEARWPAQPARPTPFFSLLCGSNQTGAVCSSAGSHGRPIVGQDRRFQRCAG
jgi:hypothetical protein